MKTAERWASCTEVTVDRVGCPSVANGSCRTSNSRNNRPRSSSSSRTGRPGIAQSPDAVSAPHKLRMTPLKGHATPHQTPGKSKNQQMRLVCDLVRLHRRSGAPNPPDFEITSVDPKRPPIMRDTGKPGAISPRQSTATVLVASSKVARQSPPVTKIALSSVGGISLCRDCTSLARV